MKIWLDAQLPPALAPWIATDFGVETVHLRDTPLKHADDHAIFAALRTPSQVLATKDEDFADLVARLDAPPQILWIRIGNLTTRALRRTLAPALPRCLEHLRQGDALVEVSAAT